MNSVGRILAFLLLPSAFAFGVSAQTVTRNIPYTLDSTGVYHADLYRPAEQTAKEPAVVLIHGGSWRSGHKKEMARIAKDLAAHGYVCFAIDYDTHPRSFPLSWQESRSAVEYLRSHAAEFGADPERIAVLGSSAGGELAALLALEPAGPASDATRRAVPVEAGVSLNGGYDAHVHSILIKRYLGGKPEAIPAVYDDASPQNHIRSGCVPLFIGHGDHDHLIPYTQASTFVSHLRERNAPVTPFVAQGGGHNYWKKKKFYAANLAAIEMFLDNALRKG
jgi:acetyl esterase/lipase